MSIKGTLNADHIPTNKYALYVVGVTAPNSTFTCTKISGLKAETDVAQLPDRTVASGGGNKKTGQFTVESPEHHTAEQVAWQLWYNEGLGNPLPTYKKVGVLQVKSLSNEVIRTYSLTGMWVSAYETQERDMASEGGLSVTKYTIEYDDCTMVS
jgi:hypothetical protein